MGKAVVFLSGKGGTGKTSAVAAISSYLVLMGKRVICIDADPIGGLDLSLGISEQSVYNLDDVSLGVCTLSDALTEIRGFPSGFNIQSNSFRFGKLGTSTQLLKEIIENLKKRCDWLFIDAPAGLENDYPADIAIFVVNTDNATYRAASTVSESVKINNSFMIVNRVSKQLLSKFKTNIDDAIDSVGIRLLGYVPDDKTIPMATMKGRPTAFYQLHSDESPAQLAFKTIARRLNSSIVTP